MSGIEHRRGGLLAAPERIIAHGCNALGRYGSGVAKAINRAYPNAYQAYRDKFEREGLVLGEVVPWEGADRVVLNCITQQNYGRVPGVVYVDYDAVRKCMQRIEKAAIRHMAQGKGAFNNHHAIAIPRIGAGTGGGDWQRIEAIIAEEIKAIRVVVYTP